VLLIQEITEFISRNPVTGAGYLGVWILPGAPTGSAHSQYLDVLFRTGVVGLLAYVFVLTALMRRLVREQQGLFWGVVGIFIYGLFHETFKESHGAGVLAFLVGMLAQSYRDQREEARDSAAVRADRRFRPVSSAADLPPTE
jgi:O-antigen ligase